MKKILKPIKFIGSVLLRFADKSLFGGFFENTITEKKLVRPVKDEKSNIIGYFTETISEAGKLDKSNFVSQILAATIPLILLLSLIFGWIDLQTLKEIIKIDYFMDLIK